MLLLQLWRANHVRYDAGASVLMNDAVVVELVHGQEFRRVQQRVLRHVLVTNLLLKHVRRLRYTRPRDHYGRSLLN